MNEEWMILMDRLDELFDQISKHDWNVPLWLRLELRQVQAQYRRINDALEVIPSEEEGGTA